MWGSTLRGTDLILTRVTAKASAEHRIGQFTLRVPRATSLRSSGSPVWNILPAAAVDWMGSNWPIKL